MTSPKVFNFAAKTYLLADTDWSLKHHIIHLTICFHATAGALVLPPGGGCATANARALFRANHIMTCKI